jgi:hypothetical protein
MPLRHGRLARWLDDRPDAPLSSRFVSGALVGAFFCIFTPLLLALWVFGGREAMIRGINTRLDLLTIAYPLGALVSHSLLYGLTALVRTKPARAFLGVVAFIPWFAGMALCMDGGHADWRLKHTALTALGALSFGLPLGWGMREPQWRRRKQASRRSAV